MGLLTKFGDDVRTRAAQQFSGWVVPKGRHALRVNNLVSAYTLAVFLVAMLLLGAVSGKGMNALFVLLAAVLAVSQVAKSHVIPALYTNLAPRFGWPSWSDGWAQDDAEAGGANPAPSGQAMAEEKKEKKPEPGVVTSGISSENRQVLTAWAALAPDRRNARSLEVAGHLKATPELGDLLVIDETFPEDVRRVVATRMLEMLAKTEKITTATE